MTTDNEPPKRSRGRPRKPLPENPEPKRPRGRPCKPRPENPAPSRPPGRPTKAEDDKKTKHVPLRFTPAEHELLHRLADDAGMPLTNFIMRIVWDKLRGEGVQL